VTVLREEMVLLRRVTENAWGDEQKSSQACICGTSLQHKLKSSIHYKQCPYTRRLRNERRVCLPQEVFHSDQFKNSHLSSGSSFSMWLSVKAGCQSGKALKSRILAHTSSIGALITELLKILAIEFLLPCYLKGL